MAKYTMRYVESYDRYYDIEAESVEEAEEKLLDRIYSGLENPPENCIDSYCEFVYKTEE